MIPLTERVEIVRNVRFVDAAIPALTHDKVEIWKDLRFNVLIKGNDWQGTEKGNKLERGFAALGFEVVYFPYTLSTSSSALRRALQNIDDVAGHLSNDAILERGLKGFANPAKEISTARGRRLYRAVGSILD